MSRLRFELAATATGSAGRPGGVHNPPAAVL
jgi:hypothetical protein